MERIEIKCFDALKERYGDPEVYLSHTDTFTLVSIPEWNWSFLWNVSLDDSKAKEQLVKSLLDPMFEDAAEAFVNELYNYLMMK